MILVSSSFPKAKKKDEKKRKSSTEIQGSDVPSAKRKLVDTDKMFKNRIDSASSAKFLIRSSTVESLLSSSFRVTNSSTSRATYDVKVTSVPSCSCSDYRKNVKRVLCKHILFICLTVLKGDGTADEVCSALKGRYLDDEILKKLLTTTIDAKYKAKKPRATTYALFLKVIQISATVKNGLHIERKRGALDAQIAKLF